jgi:hypothetical protein
MENQPEDLPPAEPGVRKVNRKELPGLGLREADRLRVEVTPGVVRPHRQQVTQVRGVLKKRRTVSTTRPLTNPKLPTRYEFGILVSCR